MKMRKISRHRLCSVDGTTSYNARAQLLFYSLNILFSGVLVAVVVCLSSLFTFRKRSTQSELLDVFYCGHVTYQIWAWLEVFKGNVNRTNTANFDATGLQEPKQGGFEIPLATDL